MRKNLLPYLLSLLCLLSCIKEKQTGADLAVGDRIPDFSVTMNDGTIVTGEQLRQGTSFIMFFTTVCEDCRKTLPQVQTVYNLYKDNGVRFVLISRSEGPESIQTHWSEHKFTMPYSAQTGSGIYELFARTRVPRIYICQDGIIKSMFTDDPVPTAESLVLSLDGSDI